MARQAKKTTGKSDLVQCGECKRWCYLDETAFASLADAEKASFVCKLCEGLKVAVQLIEASIEELKGELGGRGLSSKHSSEKHVSMRRLPPT
ncbi:hypothetical protein MTO96_010362 [Rhipicephalus appendiculatus]